MRPLLPAGTCQRIYLIGQTCHLLSDLSRSTKLDHGVSLEYLPSPAMTLNESETYVASKAIDVTMNDHDHDRVTDLRDPVRARDRVLAAAHRLGRRQCDGTVVPLRLRHIPQSQFQVDRERVATLDDLPLLLCLAHLLPAGERNTGENVLPMQITLAEGVGAGIGHIISHTLRHQYHPFNRPV